MEMMLLYVFSHEIPINWALVIMYHMVIHDEMVGGLPYARLLTKIFKYYGVDLTGEPHPVMNDKYAIDVPIINLKMGPSNQELLKYIVGLRHDMMEQFQQLSLSFVSQQEGYDDGEDIDEN
ncbi:hypothetical protein KIW84_075254 [Lathyrus oleraceus]|uniref:Uncharacterized protein n=1 Tax=Pisum sativum TaxID=3888 RepID=A0A9D4ZZL9_PEA|nr:hypothetical protein KIW84_075254 [Pisum sativum]